jgi:hypothetical protein
MFRSGPEGAAWTKPFPALIISIRRMQSAVADGKVKQDGRPIEPVAG